MGNQVNINATRESAQEFFNSMGDLDMPKKKILNSLMKQYKVNVKEARALYKTLLPQRKRHGGK